MLPLMQDIVGLVSRKSVPWSVLSTATVDGGVLPPRDASFMSCMRCIHRLRDAPAMRRV
jgi:hypothetical protein